MKSFFFLASLWRCFNFITIISSSSALWVPGVARVWWISASKPRGHKRVSLPSCLPLCLSVCLFKVVISRCPPNQTHPPRSNTHTYSLSQNIIFHIMRQLPKNDVTTPHPETNPNDHVQPHQIHHAPMPCTDAMPVTKSPFRLHLT